MDEVPSSHSPPRIPWPAALQRGARQLLPRSEHSGLRGLSAAYLCPQPVLKLCILPTVNNLGKGQALSTPTEGSGDVRGFPWFLPSFRVSCTHSRLRLRQYATGTCEPQLTLTQYQGA